MATKRRQSRKKITQRKSKRKQMNGGNFSVPISKFYPQNTFENDPSRQMRGGKKHSRKYLRGGNSSFFSQFGSVFGANQIAEQITGGQHEQPLISSSYKV